jgi:hypothetical protein
MVLLPGFVIMSSLCVYTKTLRNTGRVDPSHSPCMQVVGAEPIPEVKYADLLVHVVLRWLRHPDGLASLCSALVV